MSDSGAEVVWSEKQDNISDTVNEMMEGLDSEADPDFAFIFASPVFNQEQLVEELDSQIDFPYVGCTTAGEITPEGPKEDTITALFIDREDMSFDIASQQNIHTEPEEKGEKIAESIKESMDESKNNAVFLMTSGVTRVDEPVGYKVLEGISSVIPSDIPVSGGSAGDNMNLSKTFQFTNNNLMQDGAIAVGISSDLSIDSVQSHGKDEVLDTGIVKKREGRELLEIKDKSAAEFYADAIGEDLSDLKKIYDLPLKKSLLFGLSFIKNKMLGRDPLVIGEIFNYSLDYAISEDLGPGQEIVTQPISITSRNGIMVSREIEENQVIKIIEGKRSKIVSAGAEALEDISNPVFALFADCATRKSLLEEEELEEEVDEMSEKVGPNFCGWYAMGEIGQGVNMLCTHMNQTVSGLVFNRKD